MKMLRKYIQKCVEEIFVDEETSSSDKQNGVTTETDQSMWDAEFKASAPDSGFPKTDKSMWSVEFGANSGNKSTAPSK